MRARFAVSLSRRAGLRSARLQQLALLLCLPACHSWQPVELAPTRDFGPGARVRVERLDLSRIAFSGPRVVGDSLLGLQGGSSTHVAIALTDVRSAHQRHFSGTRTTLLVGAVGLGVALVVVGSYMNRDKVACAAVSPVIPC